MMDIRGLRLAMKGGEMFAINLRVFYITNATYLTANANRYVKTWRMFICLKLSGIVAKLHSLESNRGQETCFQMSKRME